MNGVQTQASIRRDFVEWHLGRHPYVFWALDVDTPAVAGRVAACAGDLGTCLLDGYVRQPHVTLDVCGFPVVRPSRQDEFDSALLVRQLSALRATGPAPFSIEIGNPASFLSAAYLAVGDDSGGIAALRRCLAVDGKHRLFGDYVPHVTVGLYAEVQPFAQVLERLAAACVGDALRCRVDRLSLMSYAPSEIGGRLDSLACYCLVSGEWRWNDIARHHGLGFLEQGMGAGAQ